MYSLEVYTKSFDPARLNAEPYRAESLDTARDVAKHQL